MIEECKEKARCARCGEPSWIGGDRGTWFWLHLGSSVRLVVCQCCLGLLHRAMAATGLFPGRTRTGRFSSAEPNLANQGKPKGEPCELCQGHAMPAGCPRCKNSGVEPAPEDGEPTAAFVRKRAAELGLQLVYESSHSPSAPWRLSTPNRGWVRRRRKLSDHEAIINELNEEPSEFLHGISSRCEALGLIVQYHVKRREPWLILDEAGRLVARRSSRVAVEDLLEAREDAAAEEQPLGDWTSVDNLLRHEQVIKAIKRYRDATHVGLREAREAVNKRRDLLKAKGEIK